jgi:L-fuconate dehydratase
VQAVAIKALGAIVNAAWDLRARLERKPLWKLPAYATTPGWPGYDADKLVRLSHEAVAEGFEQIKLKVGADVADDTSRLALGREAVGWEIRIALDANQTWGADEAILLLAAKHGVPVCPHAGGVGLCEMVQHLAMFDYVALSGSQDHRAIEYVDHLHEHFVEPVVVRGGRYLAPTAPGAGARMHRSSIEAFAFPTGAEWATAGSPAASQDVVWQAPA